jgi:hypothetical protein
LTIAGLTFTVSQAAACSYSINPDHKDVGKDGGTFSVAITAGALCPWTATSNASWITVTSGTAGVGNGTVQYLVARHTGNGDRTGTLTIAGLTFTVKQKD